MWTREVLGTDVYHLIQWFMIYSILGWVVESIYMSFCLRRPTNRGFLKGPFCPIYGFGALGAYFMLRPFSGNYVLLYFMGAVLATAFEYLVARLMMKVFREVWWDYSDKPLNYQGVICLESSIAWGFYTVFLFLFLQKGVQRFVDSYPYHVGITLGRIVLILFVLDFVHSLYVEKRDELPESLYEMKENLLSRIRF